jgi:voltage-gated potassium channel
MANIEPTRDSPIDHPSTPGDRLALLGVGTLATLIAAGHGRADYEAAKAKLRELVGKDPIDSLLATVLGGGLLFYALERDKNPRCNTYWDAVLYVATSLSVGYDDVFPKTQSGNALAALIQTFGPALASNALRPPASAPDEGSELLAVNKAILARLEEISKQLAAK